MGLDKETFSVVNKTKPYGAMDMAAVPGNPKIIKCFTKSPNMVIPHAIIFRQDNFDAVTPHFKLPT